MHPDITSGHSPYRTWAEAKFFLVLAFALGLQHWKSAHRRALLQPILTDGGSPPLGGNCCFTVGYLRSWAITTNLTLQPLLFTLWPPLSHTLLSHTPLPHYDHCSHTMTNSTTVSRINGTKALPPARLPGAQNRNPLSHKGLCRNRGAGLRPTVKGTERGDGLPKRWQVSVGCGRRKAVPMAQAPCQTWPCKVLGHSRTDQYKLFQKPPPLGMSTSSKWASAPL